MAQQPFDDELLQIVVSTTGDREVYYTSSSDRAQGSAGVNTEMSKSSPELGNSSTGVVSKLAAAFTKVTATTKKEEMINGQDNNDMRTDVEIHDANGQMSKYGGICKVVDIATSLALNGKGNIGKVTDVELMASNGQLSESGGIGKIVDMTTSPVTNVKGNNGRPQDEETEGAPSAVPTPGTKIDMAQMERQVRDSTDARGHLHPNTVQEMIGDEDWCHQVVVRGGKYGKKPLLTSWTHSHLN